MNAFDKTHKKTLVKLTIDEAHHVQHIAVDAVVDVVDTLLGLDEHLQRRGGRRMLPLGRRLALRTRWRVPVAAGRSSGDGPADLPRHG